MTAMTPQEIATKWATNLGAAGPSITAGVNAVTTAPGQLAAAASGKWLARVTAAQAKFERNVSSVTLASWKSSMTTLGIPRIATGAQNSIPKFTTFMTSWLSYVGANAATIDAMPTDTLQQSIAKATAQITYTANYPGYR